MQVSERQQWMQSMQSIRNVVNLVSVKLGVGRAPSLSQCGTTHGPCVIQSITLGCSSHRTDYILSNCTVRKMDLILRPIERRPQMQFSMARRFKLQLLRRYSVKFSKMHKFALGTPWLGKLKNTGRRRTSILRICSLWLWHCATVTCDTRAVF